MSETEKWHEMKEAACKSEPESLLKEERSGDEAEYVSRRESPWKCNAKCDMICKTLAMVAVWICMGMRVFTEFATIPNLRMRLKADVEDLSYALSFGAMGGLFAAPLAAFADRYGQYSDIILSLLLILAAVSNGIKPYCSSLTSFTITDLVQEMAWTVIAPIGDSITARIWGAKAGPPLHAIHTGYTIGAIIAPFIVSAFVPEKTNEISATLVNMMNASHVQRNTTEGYELKDDILTDNSRIEYAYLICSIFMVLIAIIFFVFQIINLSDDKKRTKNKSYKWKAILNPSVWAEGSASKGILVFITMNLFYICHLGVLKGPNMLLTTYAVDSDLNFTNTEAVELASVASISCLIARCLLIVVSGFVNINTILIVTIHGQLIASLCLLLFGTQSKEMLWVFTGVFGAIVRPLWSVGYQWANDYIMLVAFLLAITRIVTRTVDIGQNALQGFLYSSVSIDSLFYTSVVYAAINCVVLYTMLLIGKHFRTRHKNIKN